MSETTRSRDPDPGDKLPLTGDYTPGSEIGFQAPTSEGGVTEPLPRIPGYALLGLLGRGAMGVVYKALDTRLNRLVALKMMLGGEQVGSDRIARFRREAVTVARLQHPNIVQIYEVGESGGVPYLALEYVAGETLTAWA